MIIFLDACEIAKKTLTDRGCLGGFVSIRENSEKWFFLSCFDNDGKIEYGNTPVFVDKKTGNCNNFMMFAPGNLKIYDEAKVIDIPEEYKLNKQS